MNKQKTKNLIISIFISFNMFGMFVCFYYEFYLGFIFFGLVLLTCFIYSILNLDVEDENESGDE